VSTVRVLNWRSNHDERSRDFPIRTKLPATVARKHVFWRGGRFRTDQGREGACVGFSWTNELMARPNVVKLPDPNAFGRLLYHSAQTLDVWPGENYEGTSVLAGAKAAQKAGYIGEYRWAFGVDDVVDALCANGPVVVGIPWLDGMYDTRSSGLVDVSGDVVGGHAILLTGYHPGIRLWGEGWRNRFEVVKWRNSWGSSYGRNGDGYIRVEDLARLLADQGEACVPMRRYTRPIT